ncbi:MAG: glycosyltransferase family 4 protein [Desulfobacterales bacterium]|nr:glycosyltransferase family 4 protein [Desulfobacterales bacterium]
MTAFAGKKKKVLIIVENLPLPFDRRVWQEANTLKNAGHKVSIICPTGKGYEKKFETINGIDIFRHPLPVEGSGALGYLIEYSTALFWEFVLSIKILWKNGFDIIQACNPPDNIFLIGLFYKLLFRKKFIFDHHDINPELYIAKFGRKDFFYKIMLLWERLTFMTADLSIATNESYRKIAIERGKMDPDKVTVVRSGPSLERLRIVPPNLKWKNGRKFMVGYVGVMGQQEGIDHLLQAARILVFEKNRKDIQFVLIGGGTELEDMKALCNESGLDDFVTFTGRIPDEPMVEALCSADVCVNPDIANDMNDKSTMNKIMEYMALRKAIVQYDLTEGRFSARKASMYAEKNNPGDMAEKIVYLLENPEVREEMADYGNRRVMEELHWGIEAPKYLGVYDKI